MTLMLGGMLFYLLPFLKNLRHLYPGPIHEFASDGTCVIGLKPFGYIPLLTYDVYVHGEVYKTNNTLTLTTGRPGILAFSLRSCFCSRCSEPTKLCSPSLNN